MLIQMLVLDIPLNFPFFGDAVIEGGFVDGVCLASHGTLISGDFVGLDKDGIGWHLHAFIDVHHVSH
jgi:hypothetical protein